MCSNQEVNNDRTQKNRKVDYIPPTIKEKRARKKPDFGDGVGIMLN